LTPGSVENGSATGNVDGELDEEGSNQHDW
jgi:hypothetical protein